MSKMINKILLGFCSFALVLLASVASGDITNALPQAYAVYGGTIGVIDAIEVAPNKTRVFVSTDSANSVFYADVDYSNPEPFGTNFMFRVVPDMDADASLGAPNWIAVHQQSGRIFAGVSSGLVSSTISSGSITTNIADPMGCTFVLIQDSHLFAACPYNWPNPPHIRYGTLDADGNLTLGSSLNTNLGYNAILRFAVNPANRKLYVLSSPVGQTTNSTLFRSSDEYDAFDSETFFWPVSLTGITLSGISALAAGPDGRLFLGGGSNTNGDLAWSDNYGLTWTNIATSGSGSGSGLNIVCNGSSNSYKVYFGGSVSSNKGLEGTWSYLGGRNPGSIKVDPLNSNVMYFTVDRGFGVSTNAGVNVAERINGLLAVQIYDIDVLSSKSVAWVGGSVAGMRRATNFNGTPVWVDGYLSSPSVNCVAIDKTDPSGLTGYAGVYKTTTGGGTNASAWKCVFTNALPDGQFQDIKASGDFIVLGYFGYSSTNCSGGVYMTQDGGSNWNNVIPNVNVNNLLFLEKAGAGVVYVAAAKTDRNGGDLGRGGIYRIDTNSLTVVMDMTNEVDIRDLAADSMGGIYASGTVPDVIGGRYKAVAYYRGTNSTEWTQLTTNSLPGELVNQYMSVPITVAKDNATNDVPVLAAGYKVYYLPYGGSSWTTVATYPNGTQIRTIFWDELLVGTTIGLYAQGLNTESVVTSIPLAADFDGDAKADAALFNTNGNWKIKLSSGGYMLIPLTGFLGGSGYTALATDFDGDRLADPTVYQSSSGTWLIKMSSSGYNVLTLANFLGGTDYVPLAGDFDGDRLADPAVYQASTGTWKVKLSTAGYLEITKPDFLGDTGWTAIAADFDGDRLVDPAIYEAATESWVVMLSSSGYSVYALDPHFLGGNDYVAFAADFDGDRLADPAVAESSTGHWKLKLSSGGYSLVDLPDFLGE